MMIEASRMTVPAAAPPSAADPVTRRRRVALEGPFDLVRTLFLTRRGRLDPTTRLGAQEAWRATRTPEGPATLHLAQRGAVLDCTAWGLGASRVLDAVPALCGLDRTLPLLTAHHPLVGELQRRFAGMRLGRTEAVLEALVPTILEQRVVGLEARRSYARLVHMLSEPAPGPGRLMLPPSPARLAAAPYWRYHHANVERSRAETVRRVASSAGRIEQLTALGPAELQRRLCTVAGIGVWTAAEVSLVALGDPDAVAVGDYHLPSLVCWALAGRPRGTDEEMLELLEPYHGQRGRVIRWLLAAGVAAPRFGAGHALQDIRRR